MNLHAIAAPYVAAVNPLLQVTVQFSHGPTIQPDGSQVPTYSPPVTMMGQVQSLTFRDLTQIAGMNLTGTRRAIYLLGDVEGTVRVELKGGNLVTFPDGPPCRLCQGSGIEADDVYGASTCTECWGTGVAKNPKPLRPSK